MSEDFRPSDRIILADSRIYEGVSSVEKVVTAHGARDGGLGELYEPLYQ